MTGLTVRKGGGQHWAVIGGGMLGMTVALELAREGHRVTMYESSDRLGGLADAWRLGDVVWDRHYHVTLFSDEALRSVLRELDLEREIRWVTTKTGFYGDNQVHSLSSSLEFVRFPLLRLVDKARLAATILYASRLQNGRSLENVPVAEWLSGWSGRRTFERIWLPLLRAKLGEEYRRVSAAFIWATIRRMYAARRSGAKRELFGYVRGGYARILDRFAEYLEEQDVEIRLQSAVHSVCSSEDGLRIRSMDGANDQVDAAVLTIPSPLAASLCPELSWDEKQRLGAIEYQGIVCASLLLRRPLSPYYLTNIIDSGLPFTAVVEMTALVDRAQFGGRSLVYLPRYLAPQDPYFECSDEEIRKECTRGLARMYPEFRPEDIVSSQVSRVRRVFALPTLGYSDRLPSVATSVPGLYILNSSHIVDGTLNVDEVVRLARRNVPDLQANELKRNARAKEAIAV